MRYLSFQRVARKKRRHNPLSCQPAPILKCLFADAPTSRHIAKAFQVDIERIEDFRAVPAVQPQPAYLLSAREKKLSSVLTRIATQSARTLASAHRLVRGGSIVVEANMMASSFQHSS